MPRPSTLDSPPRAQGTEGGAPERPRYPAIAGYEIQGLLGRGGMGAVYLARHLRLNRMVALKVILTGSHASSEELARFQAEAAAVARLQHPNIVQIYDVGEHAEAGAPAHPFMALEYVPGGTLAQKVAKSPFSPREAAALVEVLARTMHHAHQCGILHRDLKPDNVLLTSEGAPKITDFGLAKNLTAAEGLTQSGQVMGTPHYMAPEQAAGQARSLGPGTDVYALGAILYALMTGRAPFRAASLQEVLDQVRHREPVPPSQIQVGLPRDLETICLKCLQKELRRRYPSALELADDLRRFLADEPIQARPIGRIERTTRWCRRYPLPASLLALLALALFGAAGGWAVAHAQRVRAEDNEGKEKTQRLKTEEALEKLRIQEKATARAASRARASEAQMKAANAENIRTLAYTRVLLAAQYENSGAIELADQTLEECPADLRGWEWRYLKRLSAGSSRVLRGHAAPVLALAFSRDGRRLASVSQDRAARVWSPATGAELAASSPSSSPLAFQAPLPVLCPDGRALLVPLPFRMPQIIFPAPAGPNGGQPLGPLPLPRPQVPTEWEAASLRDLSTGKEVFSLKAPYSTPTITRFLFSPDGTQVAGACQSFEGRLRLWDARTGKLIRLLPGNDREVKEMAFSPDGRALATVGVDNGNRGELKLWDIAQGKAIFTFATEPLETLTAVAFSPDGKYLAVCGKGKHQLEKGALTMKGIFKLWELSTQKEPARPPELSNPISSLVFSPDSRLLATLDSQGVARVVDLAGGSEVLKVPGWGSEIPYAQVLAFSPDSKLLALGGGYGVRLWDITARAALLELRGHSSAVLAVAFSPDGSTLASGGADNFVRLWDMGEARRPRLLPAGDSLLELADLSPDGEVLAMATHARSGRIASRITLYRTATGTVLKALPSPGDYVQDLGFAPDGKQLFTASDSGVILWDITSGDRRRTFSGHNATQQRPGGGARGAAFSPDGKRVASTGCDSTVQLWNVSDGAVVFRHQETFQKAGFGQGVAFSSDGQRLAVAFHQKTLVFDLSTQELLCTIPVGAPMALNPAGTRLVTRGGQAEIQVWDASNGKHCFNLRGHLAAVDGLAFTPDGSRLASASWDGTVKLWDLETRREVLTLRGPHGFAAGARFNAHGDRLISRHAVFTGTPIPGPGEVHIWDARSLPSASSPRPLSP